MHDKKRPTSLIEPKKSLFRFTFLIDNSTGRPESISPNNAHQSGFKSTMKKIAGKVRGRNNSLRGSSGKLKHFVVTDTINCLRLSKTVFGW
jgi:hypothetical protein